MKNKDSTNTARVFRERFQLLRGRRTMDLFGHTIGITRQSVSNYESGTRIPNSVDLAKICKVCGCTSDWLLGLSEVKSYGADAQAISNLTGLSETAIRQLGDMTADQRDLLQRIIDAIAGGPTE